MPRGRGRGQQLNRIQSSYATAGAAASTGKTNWNVAPDPGFGVAHKRPPCDSMIVCAYQIAWISKGTNLASQVDSGLPQSCGVKTEPLPKHHFVEINVDSSANSLPTRLSLL